MKELIMKESKVYYKPKSHSVPVKKDFELDEVRSDRVSDGWIR